MPTITNDWRDTADGREAAGPQPNGSFIADREARAAINRRAAEALLDKPPRDLKQTAGKPQLSQHPRVPAIWGARVRAYGAKKYARGNYLRRKATPAEDLRRASDYADAVLRHLLAQTDVWERVHGSAPQAASGADRHPEFGFLALDPESGLPHLAHALCSLEMLIAQMSDAGMAPADPGEGNEPPITAASAGNTMGGGKGGVGGVQ